MEETARARDALLVFGEAETAATSVLISSSTNRFRNVLSGVTLEVKQAADTPVTITVSTSDTDLVATVQVMVDNLLALEPAASESDAISTPKRLADRLRRFER